MFQQVSDLREEARELDALLVTLTEADWWLPTPFKGWAPFDVLAHLHRTDLTSSQLDSPTRPLVRNMIKKPS